MFQRLSFLGERKTEVGNSGDNNGLIEFSFIMQIVIFVVGEAARAC
jgi:hypothetical protein